MADIVEQAEKILNQPGRYMGRMGYRNQLNETLARLVPELVTELKAARAEQTLDAAGLAAVPRGAVIRSVKGTIACRYDELLGVVFGDDRPFDWNRLTAPATLLWIPR
jgi:hypothetical protein